MAGEIRARPRLSLHCTNNRHRSRVYPGVLGEVAEIELTGGGLEAEGRGRLADLFDTHHPRLYRLARRLTGSADEARDLVQDTFLRAARKYDSIPAGRGSEEAWLVRVLTNLCRDEWRQRSTRRRLDITQTDVTPRVVGPRTEDALVARDLVWAALATLDPRRRAAIVLFELEGVAIPEIARLLGVSPVTVRWHLSRGRKELLKQIEHLNKGASSEGGTK